MALSKNEYRKKLKKPKIKKESWIQRKEESAFYSGALNQISRTVKNPKAKIITGALSLGLGIQALGGIISKTRSAPKGKKIGAFAKGVLKTQVAAGAGMLGAHGGYKAITKAGPKANIIFRRIRGKTVPIKVKDNVIRPNFRR